jgi:hypothetical protein
MRKILALAAFMATALGCVAARGDTTAACSDVIGEPEATAFIVLAIWVAISFALSPFVGSWLAHIRETTSRADDA